MANDKAPSPWQSNRFVVVALGVVLGALWGMVMWGITSLLGQDSGTRGLIYLAITMAMIGGGVAAFFGAFIVKRSGERVSPRIRRDR